MESILPSVQDQVEKDVRKHKYWMLIAELLPCELVSHGGGDERGEFCQTLCLTDVCSTWTEAEAEEVAAGVDGLTARLFR